MATIRKKAGVRKAHRAFARAEIPEVAVTFLLQDWEDSYNVGGLYRIADAVGCKEIYSSGRTPQLPDPMIPVTSLGHHRRIACRHFTKHEDAAEAAISDGWTLVAVEIADGAVCYNDFAYPERTCLVLGNEATGVYGNVLRHCQGVVFIPQFGKGRSMNVHVAGAVVAYRARMGVGSIPAQPAP